MPFGLCLRQVRRSVGERYKRSNTLKVLQLQDRVHLCSDYPRNDSSERLRELCRSLRSAFSLICRTLSRVIWSSVPISSSVIGSAPSSPKYGRRILDSRACNGESDCSIASDYA